MSQLNRNRNNDGISSPTNPNSNSDHGKSTTQHANNGNGDGNNKTLSKNARKKLRVQNNINNINAQRAKISVNFRSPGGAHVIFNANQQLPAVYMDPNEPPQQHNIPNIIALPNGPPEIHNINEDTENILDILPNPNEQFPAPQLPVHDNNRNNNHNSNDNNHNSNNDGNNDGNNDETEFTYEYLRVKNPIQALLYRKRNKKETKIPRVYSPGRLSKIWQHLKVRKVLYGRKWKRIVRCRCDKEWINPKAQRMEEHCLICYYVTPECRDEARKILKGKAEKLKESRSRVLNLISTGHIGANNTKYAKYLETYKSKHSKVSSGDSGRDTFAAKIDDDDDVFLSTAHGVGDNVIISNCSIKQLKISKQTNNGHNNRNINGVCNADGAVDDNNNNNNNNFDNTPASDGIEDIVMNNDN
eukprot:81977_1